MDYYCPFCTNLMETLTGPDKFYCEGIFGSEKVHDAVLIPESALKAIHVERKIQPTPAYVPLLTAEINTLKGRIRGAERSYDHIKKKYNKLKEATKDA